MFNTMHVVVSMQDRIYAWSEAMQIIILDDESGIVHAAIKDCMCRIIIE